jgi:hypothetical protein
VLRDFHAKLQDAEGRVLSERQYLEASLKPERGIGDGISARNRTCVSLGDPLPPLPSAPPTSRGDGACPPGATSACGERTRMSRGLGPAH